MTEEYRQHVERLKEKMAKHGLAYNPSPSYAIRNEIEYELERLAGGVYLTDFTMTHKGETHVYNSIHQLNDEGLRVFLKHQLDQWWDYPDLRAMLLDFTRRTYGQR